MRNVLTKTVKQAYHSSTSQQTLYCSLHEHQALDQGYTTRSPAVNFRSGKCVRQELGSRDRGGEIKPQAF